MYWRSLTKKVAPSIEHMTLLRDLDINLIIDIGANKGQFLMACRHVHPSVRFIAFEPLKDEYDLLCQIAREGDYTFNFALGDSEGVQEFNITSQRDSSSLLDDKFQSIIHKNVRFKDKCPIHVKRLDDIKLEGLADKTLMKLDVQGYELKVLKGGIQLIKNVQFIYLEVSTIEFYEGQPLAQDIISFLNSHGFALWKIMNPTDRRKEVLQCDMLFQNMTQS